MRFSGWERVATFACGSQLAPLPWDYDPPAPGMYTTLCTYEPATGAWATCFDQVISHHVSPSQYDKVFNGGIYFVNLVCRKAGGNLAQFTANTYNASLQNATKYLSDIPSGNGTLHGPVLLDFYNRERIVDAVHAEFANLDYSNDSVLWIYWYFALVLLVLTAVQHIPAIRKYLLRASLVNKFRSRLQLPTFWNTEKHTQHAAIALGGFLPTSLEAVLLCGFFVVHSLSLTLKYSVDPREVLETVPLQLLQGLGNRSGIVSFGLLPAVFFLSSRSSLLPFLTGLRYTTFLVLHRWLGRIMVVDAVIHSIAFYYHEYFVGELAAASAQFWWVAGIWATVLSCIILVQATGLLRSRWYEIFLYAHIAIAIAFLWLCWEHAKKFGWTYWIWGSAAIWGLERIHRVYSVARNGLCHAEATLINPKLIVLNIPKPAGWNDHPTQFAFIHFLLPSIFWQSHPFTLSSCGQDLKLVILVKDGATKALQRAVAQRSLDPPSSPVSIPLLLEGPCGISPDLTTFEDVILISGGSGIPGPLAEALHLRRTSEASIHFIAVVRDIDVLKAYQEELAELGAPGNVQIDIHYTGREDTVLADIRRDRPNIEAMLGRHLKESSSVGIMCCGPPGMNDSTRNLVAKFVMQYPHKRIEYFEEYQTW